MRCAGIGLPAPKTGQVLQGLDSNTVFPYCSEERARQRIFCRRAKGYQPRDVRLSEREWAASHTGKAESLIGMCTKIRKHLRIPTWRVALITMMILASCCPMQEKGQDSQTSEQGRAAPKTAPASQQDVSPPLREMPPAASAPHPPREVPIGRIPPPEEREQPKR